MYFSEIAIEAKSIFRRCYLLWPPLCGALGAFGFKRGRLAGIITVLIPYGVRKISKAESCHAEAALFRLVTDDNAVGLSPQNFGVMVRCSIHGFDLSCGVDGWLDVSHDAGDQ